MCYVTMGCISDLVPYIVQTDSNIRMELHLFSAGNYHDTFRVGTRTFMHHM